MEWDSWRRPDGSWNVVARFEAKPGGPAGIGEEPPAMWTFSPARKSLQNANRWAQQLSELEPLDGPVPARRLTAVSDRPFDFETDADAAARTATAQLQVVQQLQLQQEQESDGLLDMLRSRRGQRLGVDEDADDALAKLLTNGVPAAHPRPSEVLAEVRRPEAGSPATSRTATNPAAATAGRSRTGRSADAGTPGPAADPWERRRDGRPSIMSRLTLAPRHEDGPDDALKLHDGVSTETREITIAASQLRPVGQQGPTSSPGLDELLGGGTSRRQQRETRRRCPGRPRRGAAGAPAGETEALQHSQLGRNRLRSPRRLAVRHGFTARPRAAGPLHAQSGAGGPFSVRLEAQQRDFAFGFRQRTVLAHDLKGCGPDAAGVVEGQRRPGQRSSRRRSAGPTSARTAPKSPAAMASSRVKAQIRSPKRARQASSSRAAAGVAFRLLQIQVDHPRLAGGVADSGNEGRVGRIVDPLGFRHVQHAVVRREQDGGARRQGGAEPFHGGVEFLELVLPLR